MSEETISASSIITQTKNVGYYAGLAFGIGYILTFVGIIALVAEILSYIPSYEWSIIMATIPAWLVAGLVCYLLAVICAIALGSSIIKNSKSAREHGLEINIISSSVSSFSFMILFAGIGSIILINGMSSVYSPYYYGYGYSYPVVNLPFIAYPISQVVGAILLLIGFRAYRGKQTDSKIVGAILMLISIILIYIIAYAPVRDAYNSYASFINLYPYGPTVSLPPLSGPLLSEVNVETIALLIAMICAILIAFLTYEAEVKYSIVGIVLSISTILFSIGLLYFNFSAVSLFSKLLSLPGNRLISPWIMFFGFLVLGISGIIVLIAACLCIVASLKQLSTQTRQPAAPPPPPPPA